MWNEAPAGLTQDSQDTFKYQICSYSSMRDSSYFKKDASYFTGSKK